MITPGACPFCHSSDTGLVGLGNKWKYVHCNNCGADGPPDLGESGAMESWNKIVQYAARMEKMLADSKELLQRIGANHDTCEDPWYSCPRSADYIGNDDRSTCRCWKERIDHLLTSWEQTK
jgi:hypothetical protein